MTTVHALAVAASVTLPLGAALGWRAHAVVEDRRMRRLCQQIKTEIASRH